MERTRTTGTLGTEPIRFINMGHGGHAGSKGDTSNFLAKAITQNIAYAAYHQPRTINEIAEELGINPIFVEDEVAVLEEYGFMDKLAGGKYRTNIRIYVPNETSYRIYRRIEPEYSRLFAEKFFAPVLEKITEIPMLANGSQAYKDFKVIFNGGLDSSNSIKSFKWLTKIDTSALEPQQNMVETIKSLKSTVGDDIDNVIDTVKNQKDAIKNTANELKNLFKF